MTRYLRATHCDLFFADAAILVEGPAERMLIPHFISRDFKRLHHSYVSLLEIGGSHAHKLRRLIEHLGLTTLVVTDLDSSEKVGSRLRSAAPRRKAGQTSRNATLKSWHPQLDVLDDLLDFPDTDKAKSYDGDCWRVRVAYQVPVNVQMTAGSTSEALCSTFEDSLVFENLELFRAMEGSGLIGAVREGLDQHKDAAGFSAYLKEELTDAGNGKFALDVLWNDKQTGALKAPRYISDGLSWLQDQLRREEVAIGVVAEAMVAAAAMKAPLPEVVAESPLSAGQP